MLLTAPVGQGNFHTALPYRNRAEHAEARAVAGRMTELAQSLGGTCTGEHGIGVGKLRFLQRELGGSLDLLRDIKRLIDPLDIMNPGHLIPPKPER